MTRDVSLLSTISPTEQKGLRVFFQNTGTWFDGCNNLALRLGPPRVITKDIFEFGRCPGLVG
jgi:hypothetical protein